VVDFAKMKEEYVTGKFTVNQLVEKYRVSLDTVREQIRRNQWAKEKRMVQSQALKEVMKTNNFNIMEELAILNGRDLAISNKIRDLVAARLALWESDPDDVSLGDLSLLARTHKDLQHVGRIALDANSDAVRTEILSRGKDIRDYTEEELLSLLSQEEEVSQEE